MTLYLIFSVIILKFYVSPLHLECDLKLRLYQHKKSQIEFYKTPKSWSIEALLHGEDTSPAQRFFNFLTSSNISVNITK